MSLLIVCIWRHGGHVGGTTQRNVLLVPLSDPAGVGGWHCVPHPERLIANQEYIQGVYKNAVLDSIKHEYCKQCNIKQIYMQETKYLRNHLSKANTSTIILTQLLFIFFLVLRALENDNLETAFFKRLDLEAPVLC